MNNVFLFFILLICFQGLSQEQQKDTLFFDMNSKFIIQFQEPDEYYIKYDSHPNPEYVYFIKEDTLHSLKPKEIKDLNSFIYWTVYTTKSTGPLNGLELFDYLKNYEIIFVDKEVFYKMWPGYRIE